MDDYSIEYIEPRRIGYIFEAPNYNGKFLSRPHQMRAKLSFWARMEVEVTRPDFKPEDNEEEMIAAIYRDLLWRRARRMNLLVNPLIVKRGEPGRFYTIRGNQRLCAYRATGLTDPLPCRIALPGDNWRPNTQAFLAHPYEPVEMAG